MLSSAFDNLTNVFSFGPPGGGTEASGLWTLRPNGTLFCANGECPDLGVNTGPYVYSMSLTGNGTIFWIPQLAGLYGTQFRITSVAVNAIPKVSVPLDLQFEMPIGRPKAPVPARARQQRDPELPAEPVLRRAAPVSGLPDFRFESAQICAR